jgi:hypothetical protein
MAVRTCLNQCVSISHGLYTIKSYVFLFYSLSSPRSCSTQNFLSSLSSSSSSVSSLKTPPIRPLIPVLLPILLLLLVLLAVVPPRPVSLLAFSTVSLPLPPPLVVLPCMHHSFFLSSLDSNVSPLYSEDLTCVCTNTAFQTAAGACLTANCTAAEQATAQQLQQTECGKSLK